MSSHTSAGSIYKQQDLKGMKVYPEHYVKILLLLGEKLVAQFDRFRVDYIMCGGTLLGAVRPPHKFIPGDYDLDFELLCTPGNRKRFFELVKHVRANPVGCGINCVLHLPTVVKFVPEMARELARRFGLNNPSIPNPTADVFITEPRRGGGHKIVGCQWPKWYYKAGEIFPLQTLAFSGLTWCAPNTPEKIFRRYYGKTWRIPEHYAWPTSSARTQ